MRILVATSLAAALLGAPASALRGTDLGQSCSPIQELELGEGAVLVEARPRGEIHVLRFEARHLGQPAHIIYKCAADSLVEQTILIFPSELAQGRATFEEAFTKARDRSSGIRRFSEDELPPYHLGAATWKEPNGTAVLTFGAMDPLVEGSTPLMWILVNLRPQE